MSWSAIDLGTRVVNTRNLYTRQLRIVPVKVEDDELGVDGGGHMEKGGSLHNGGPGSCLPQRLPTRNCLASLSFLTLTCNGPKTRKKTPLYAFLTVIFSVRRRPSPVARPEF